MAGPILTEISDIFTAAGISDDYISLVFKAVAVCFITQITADICRDSGETAIASAAELWGRAALVFMSLPVMRVLMEIINEMIWDGHYEKDYNYSSGFRADAMGSRAARCLR